MKESFRDSEPNLIENQRDKISQFASIKMSNLKFEYNDSKFNEDLFNRKSKRHRVVFVRHGQSLWNLENKFTGWHDVALTEKGEQQAIETGRLLRENGYTHFDTCHTSVLQRAIKTWYNIASELELNWIDHQKHWRLNERHYGALQGLNKDETAQVYGNEIVNLWRRSYDTKPPLLDENDPRHPIYDKKYRHLSPNILPRSESLQSTEDRLVPYWNTVICPQLRENKQVIVVSHCNTLRALMRHFTGMDVDEVMKLKIKNAVPIIFEFDSSLNPIDYHFLMDE